METLVRQKRRDHAVTLLLHVETLVRQKGRDHAVTFAEEVQTKFLGHNLMSKTVMVSVTPMASQKKKQTKERLEYLLF